MNSETNAVNIFFLFKISPVIRSGIESLILDGQEMELFCVDYSSEAVSRLVKLVYTGWVKFGRSIVEIKTEVTQDKYFTTIKIR